MDTRFYVLVVVVVIVVAVADLLLFLFLIHVSSTWIHMINHVGPAGRLSVFRGKTWNVGNCAQSFHHNGHTCHACWHSCLLALYSTFIDLDLGWGLQCQRQSKPICFSVSHSFQLIMIKFDVVLKQFKLNV